MAEIKIRMPPGAAVLAVEDVEFPGRGATNKVSQDPSPVQQFHGGQTPLVNDAAAFKNARSKAWIASLRQQTPLAQKLVAETIATFILVFTGCGAAMVNEITPGQVTHVGVSLAFGLVITIMIYAVGHISGAHMNPAVTLAFAIARHFPWTQVPVYMIAQCGGSIMASFCLRWILHPVASEGATLPAGSDMQSFLLEVIITFILMFVVAAVSTDSRACGELAGIAVGSAVALNALMAGPISGASMNPARSLGPAVASGNYRALWVYWAGPIIGAVTGMLAYNIVRIPLEEGDCCNQNNNNSKPAGKSFRRCFIIFPRN